jgi:hypothetical protein
MSERSGPSFAVLAYALSRVATCISAGGIALISTAPLGSVLSRWDGGWYLSIARDGYPSFVPSGTGVAAQSSIAFFPGYPIVIRMLSTPLGLSPVLVGCVVSMIAGLIASVGLWHLAARPSDDAVADRTVVLFAFMPSAFVMSMVYADALFVCLAVLCLLALLDGRWVAAGVAAAAAGLVRPTALALVIACLWAAVAAIRTGGPWRALLGPAIAPWGTLVYLAYSWFHTGEALGFFQVQSRGWGNRIDLGGANIRATLRHLGEARLTFFVAVLALVVGGLGVGFWLLLRWRVPGFVIAYVSVVMGLPILATNPVSIPRFLLAAFPLLIPLAARISPRTFLPVAATSGVLMGTLFVVTGLGTTPP